MAKSTDHFRWNNLRPMLESSGRQECIGEIEKLEAEILRLVTLRRKRLQEFLHDVVSEHQAGILKHGFRPCHERKLNQLEVDTEFWLV